MNTYGLSINGRYGIYYDCPRCAHAVMLDAECENCQINDLILILEQGLPVDVVTGEQCL